LATRWTYRAHSCSAKARLSRSSRSSAAPEGELIAEFTNVGGLLDLKKRRLVADRAQCWRSLATAPRLLGL